MDRRGFFGALGALAATAVLPKEETKIIEGRFVGLPEDGEEWLTESSNWWHHSVVLMPGGYTLDSWEAETAVRSG